MSNLKTSKIEQTRILIEDKKKFITFYYHFGKQNSSKGLKFFANKVLTSCHFENEKRNYKKYTTCCFPKTLDK